MVSNTMHDAQSQFEEICTKTRLAHSCFCGENRDSKYCPYSSILSLMSPSSPRSTTISLCVKKSMLKVEVNNLEKISFYSFGQDFFCCSLGTGFHRTRLCAQRYLFHCSLFSLPSTKYSSRNTVLHDSESQQSLCFPLP